MPKSQYGVVSKEGIDLAAHVINSAIDYSTLVVWSAFVIFLDLVRVFDKVVRELVLGRPVFRPTVP